MTKREAEVFINRNGWAVHREVARRVNANPLDPAEVAIMARCATRGDKGAALDLLRDCVAAVATRQRQISQMEFSK